MTRWLVCRAKRRAGALTLAVCSTLCVPANAQTAPSGRDLYLHACSDCHQSDGAGVPGAYPALARDPLVIGAPNLGARVVLEGAGPMPDFDQQFNDAQIAAVLTYVRSSFGNKAPAVSPAVVAGVRKALTQGH